MSIKTHIEIPVTLYADGDIEAGEIYAEITLAPMIVDGNKHTDTYILSSEDLTALVGDYGVESLAAELITDAQDRAELQAEHDNDLRIERLRG